MALTIYKGVSEYYGHKNGGTFQELPVAQEAHEVQAALLFLLEAYQARLKASFVVNT